MLSGCTAGSGKLIKKYLGKKLRGEEGTQVVKEAEWMDVQYHTLLCEGEDGGGSGNGVGGGGGGKRTATPESPFLYYA